MRASTKIMRILKRRNLPWLGAITISLIGCTPGRDRLPPTASQDPLLNSAPGRPVSTVAPAPRTDHSANTSPAAGGVDASTTSNTKAEPGKKPVNATLMAPAESQSQTNANLAMQANARVVTNQSPAGLQQAQWQSQGPQNGLEQALQRLQQLNVIEQRLELRGGQWTFTCDVPNSQNPQQKRRIEGSDATPLGAVRIVLDKLESQARQ